ncbi:hypothetical protein DFH09DRAFT_1280335 [Mycena vulgaris]|nr:hypothetical protein DFH09DRAFT_1280335 [Mycena vulgaris]
MPNQPTVTEIRMNFIVACLIPAATLLNDLSDAFGTPFVQAISSTTQSLITGVQNVKKNKDECLKLMETVHELLYAIVALHIASRESFSGNFASPWEVYWVFTPYWEIEIIIDTLCRALHKVHTFVEAQLEGNRIKRFFRQGEMAALLKDCHAELQRAADEFKIEASASTHGSMNEMQKMAEATHKQLLEWISTLSDGTTSDRSSFIYPSAIGSQNSSNSFSLLPAKPKIFHGRESELKDIVDTLQKGYARIAILGAGGMGKTSLAKAILHHPDIIAKYQSCLFVASDSATTSIELAALIGSHLGLKRGKDLTHPVVRYFSKSPACLLILDNLETIWEPTETRRAVEEFLSLLTDIEHLALIITMRGAERPAKVRWTRPYLQPLNPLSDDAAYQTFIDIADDFHDSKDIHQLLSFTDNMPLTVDLMAHLRSNLDTSITISLSSPRMTSGAQDLLSLLSVLPDGLSDIELLHSKLPIANILACKSVLLGTSLAYTNAQKRLKSLVPIREHIQQFYPVSQALVDYLCRHFQLLLDLYHNHTGAQLEMVVGQISSNLGNLHQVLLRGLHPDNPNLEDILEASYITEVFNSQAYQPIPNPEELIAQATAHFHTFDDPGLESKFHRAVGYYYFYYQNNTSAAMQSLNRALGLAKACDTKGDILNSIALMEYNMGHCHAAQIHARDAQRLAQLSPNLLQEAEALRMQAFCCRHLGDYKTSISLCHEARKLLQLCGMSGRGLDYLIMNTEAEVHLLKSEYAEARTIHTHIAQHNSQDPYNYAFALINLAEIDIMIDASAQDVHQNLDEAQRIFRAPTILNFCQMLLADLNLRQRDTCISITKASIQECLKLTWQHDTQVVLYGLERVANISQWPLSDFHWAASWTVVYLGYAALKQNRLGLHKALQFLGDVFLAEGDEHTANSLFTVALEGFTYMDIHYSRAQCMLRLGDISKNSGDLVKAVELWKEARPLFERSMQKRDVSRIDTKLAAAGQDLLQTAKKHSNN